MTHPDARGGAAVRRGRHLRAFRLAALSSARAPRPEIRTIMTSDDVMGGSTTFTMLSTTKKFRERTPRSTRRSCGARGGQREDRVRPACRGGNPAGSTAGQRILRSTRRSRCSTDPAVKFTTTPENVRKYADFMHEIGSITQPAGALEGLFFPEIHAAPGS